MSLQINAVLAQIRALQSQAQGPGAIGSTPTPIAGAPGAVGSAQSPVSNFGALMKQGIEAVNGAQMQASKVASQFERGVAGVELPEVMLEMQKASVSFRALTEVRNRFVSAYQEIMNMPI